ncbi:MAG: GIY-YIG nuclease family protein [Elusimicrobia bacterium]|nr:GIY-YIG nuclease family protein [Elusimicrobiota bacterium]
MYFVYLLKSSRTGDLYVGYTYNLRQRLQEHQNGESQWTKTRTPFALIYYEAYQNAQDARKREQQLKRQGKALGQLKRRINGSLGVLAMKGVG